MDTGKQINEMFRAFADETRLRILHLLSHGELCVCDIMEVLGSKQPKVSRHLSYLKHAGLVIDRKNGLWKHYSLLKPNAKFHHGLIKCLDVCFSEVDILKKDLKALRQLKRRAAC